ncbi:MAG TPA: EcsC family protein [Rhodothermales bacterium]|nr:EcsC family protein [Rhodothermales bacterium]
METFPISVEAAPSAYERRAYAEIQLWKEPRMGWFGRAVDGMNAAVHGATDLVRRVPGVDWTIQNVVSGLLRLTNEMVQDSVRPRAVYAAYRRNGVPVEGPADVASLDLMVVDAALKGIDTKYRALAAAEGAATGYAGASGIVPDIVALVALNLRAAGEYAAYCGFDVADPVERLVALEVLNAVSAPSDTAKQVTLAPVIRVSQRLAREQATLAVEQFALTRAIRNATEALGLRLAEAKLAQLVPVTGAVVASGFNAYYTSKVCDAAFNLYRERFLLRKYGML